MFTFDQAAIDIAKQYRNEQIRAAENHRRARQARTATRGRARPRRVAAGVVATGVVFAVGAAIAVTGATDVPTQFEGRHFHGR